MKFTMTLIGLTATQAIGTLSVPTLGSDEPEDCGSLGVAEWDLDNLPEGVGIHGCFSRPLLSTPSNLSKCVSLCILGILRSSRLVPTHICKVRITLHVDRPTPPRGV